MNLSLLTDLLTRCDVLAIGEPTHADAGVATARNELLPALMEAGVRSIVLETDRVRASIVHDHVHGASTTLDDVLAHGFSHGFGENVANRELVSLLRQLNSSRPESDRVSFHGFDPPLENLQVPSPRRYLEPVRDDLGLEVDIAALAGPDERWECQEAVMDPAASPGRSPAAAALTLVLQDLRSALLQSLLQINGVQALQAWDRRRIQLQAADHLLRYHRRAAAPLGSASQMARLLAFRDVLMAENLLDIVAAERKRGPVVVFAHNTHLQRSRSDIPAWTVTWTGAGSMVAALLGERYAFIAGSLGEAPDWELPAASELSYEGLADRALDARAQEGAWGVLPVSAVEGGALRTDNPAAHHVPLTGDTLTGAAGLLHVRTGRPVNP